MRLGPGSVQQVDTGNCAVITELEVAILLCCRRCVLQQRPGASWLGVMALSQALRKGHTLTGNLDVSTGSALAVA